MKLFSAIIVPLLTFQRMKNPEQGCIVCAKKPFLIPGRFSGIAPFTWTCPHLNKNVLVASFRNRTILRVIPILAVLFQIGIIKWNVDIVVEQEVKFVTNITVLANSLYLLIGVLGPTTATFKSRHHCTELNGLISIINSRELYGMKFLFKKTHEIATRKISFLLLFLGVFQFCVTCIPLYNSFDLYNLLRIVVSNLTCLFWAVEGSNYLSTCFIYASLFSEVNDFTIRLLKNRLRYQHSRVIDIQNLSREIDTLTNNDITKELKNMRRLYSSLIFNLRFMNHYHNFSLLAMTLIILILSVLSIYLIIMQEREKEPFIIIFVTNYKISNFIIALGLTWFLSDYVKEKAREIENFIYLYPINKLSAEEANQVELYLEMLSLQPAQLHIFNIYHPSLKLIAPVVATICTYVLVAIQFRLEIPEE